MVLITGIGNKDVKYHNTRHNAGYDAVEYMRQALRFEGFIAHDILKRDRLLLSDVATVRWGQEKVVLLQKTQTAMNRSGEAVKRVFDAYDIEEFILFHDDLDIQLGEYKIQKGKSPKGHNGVKSVEEAIGNTDFWRVRIGIDNRDGKDIPGEDYVLKRFSKEEREILNGAIVEACEDLLFTELFEKWI
jgi:PTH1 family peptidyl-tRNA hydrolase